MSETDAADGPPPFEDAVSSDDYEGDPLGERSHVPP